MHDGVFGNELSSQSSQTLAGCRMLGWEMQTRTASKGTHRERETSHDDQLESFSVRRYRKGLEYLILFSVSQLGPSRVTGPFVNQPN